MYHYYGYGYGYIFILFYEEFEFPRVLKYRIIFIYYDLSLDLSVLNIYIHL
jgi:hypothetical protein